MLKTGILNPQINSLVSRVRHTNMLVIADRSFPYWPMIATVDIALVDGVPTVMRVFRAIRPNFVIGEESSIHDHPLRAELGIAESGL